MDLMFLAMAYAAASLATMPPGGSQFGAVLGSGFAVANSRRLRFTDRDSFDLQPEEVIALFNELDKLPHTAFLVMPITRRLVANLINLDITTVIFHRNYLDVVDAYCRNLSDVADGVAALEANEIDVRLYTGPVPAPIITISNGRWNPNLLTWQGASYA